jgi:hypothetical protein
MRGGLPNRGGSPGYDVAGIAVSGVGRAVVGVIPPAERARPRDAARLAAEITRRRTGPRHARAIAQHEHRAIEATRPAPASHRRHLESDVANRRERIRGLRGAQRAAANHLHGCRRPIELQPIIRRHQRGRDASGHERAAHDIRHPHVAVREPAPAASRNHHEEHARAQGGEECACGANSPRALVEHEAARGLFGDAHDAPV